MKFLCTVPQKYMISHTEGGIQADSVPELGAKKDTWTQHDQVTGEWRRQHNKGFIICTPHQILSNHEE
jgi:hypothetical protein